MMAMCLRLKKYRWKALSAMVLDNTVSCTVNWDGSRTLPANGGAAELMKILLGPEDSIKSRGPVTLERNI
jgi:hypothetical protein